MGLFDKIKNIMSVPEDDYYDDDILHEDSSFVNKPESRYDDYSSTIDKEKRNKVVNIHATTQLKVVLVKPERFEDAPSVADHLNAKRTVVLNLESAPKEVSRRIVDFLSGVAYANNGQFKKVANNTFIITPFNVDIMGDLVLEELENSDMYI